MNKLDVENKAAANNANIFVKNNYNDREEYLEINTVDIRLIERYLNRRSRL